ncbi:succinate dehydrogenase, hydrophobic membrane anchor protein [Ramlibacter ginsenosidimutans]|uniref:Succinate dehydrogenase hydrophobic membrane anchor subunit n=2 Tax=Ramlibacter ginsenosidimutans TaxID=502333 RepID=A0A934WMN3_9BURK|nr:succinate dehydrogenase, hydrophobic membrane anchor protein [Ramlibacter ginsenosidimutans]
MLAFLIVALVSLGLHPRVTFVEWAGWVHRPAVSAAAAVFFLALCSHMWVGLRDVLIDYARPAAVRNGLLALLAAALAVLAGWVVVILFVAGA